MRPLLQFLWPRYRGRRNIVWTAWFDHGDERGKNEKVGSLGLKLPPLSSFPTPDMGVRQTILGSDEISARGLSRLQPCRRFKLVALCKWICNYLIRRLATERYSTECVLGPISRTSCASQGGSSCLTSSPLSRVLRLEALCNRWASISALRKPCGGRGASSDAIQSEVLLRTISSSALE
jgi:hypothetical protein